MELAAGTAVGPYQIVSLIGAGGMGHVYRARDQRLRRDVALKVLPDHLRSDADLLRRFELEARTAGGLNHPNLITLFELETHQSTPFMVMELLEGQTLRQKLASAIPQRKVLEWAIEIARGLAAAHTAHIVHRDLKPENIFITNDGRAKILDFGLAKPLSTWDRETSTAIPVTEPGMVLGTLGYMSPEQTRGEPADHRSDIFAFGAVLYEMLTRQPAFDGDTSVDIMHSILNAEPPPASEIPAALNRIIRRCLEKSPAQRFQNSADIAFALEALSELSASPIASRPPKLRRYGKPAIAAAVALAVGVGAGYLVSRRIAPVTQAPRWRLTQLTFSSEHETQPSIAPDGSAFVFVRRTGANYDIHFQRVGGMNSINLTPDSESMDMQPAFSPDGREIAFRSSRDGGGIFVMGATGESVRRVTGFGFNPSWSPDGKELAFATQSTANPRVHHSGSRLWKVELATGRTTKLLDETAVHPSWSPHGLRIAYTGSVSGKRFISTVSIADGTRTPAVPDAWNPVWSPDGKYLYYNSEVRGSPNLWRVAIDESTGKTGRTEQITNAAQLQAFMSIARDGSIVFASWPDQAAINRMTLDPNTGKLSQPTRISMIGLPLLTVDGSPDDRRVAFSTRGNQQEIYVMEVDGSGIRQLTNDRHNDSAPRWSPDGQKILFISNRSGQGEHFTIRLDGSALTQITRIGAVSEGFWSTDGRRVFTYVRTKNRAAVTTINDDGSGGETQWLPMVAKDVGFWPTSWSPDGTTLAGNLVQQDGANRGIAVYSFATGTYTVRHETGMYPQWLADGRRLIFYEDNRETVWLMDTVSGKITSAGDVPWFDPITRIRLNRRSNAIYYVSRESDANIWMLQADE